MLWLSRLSTVQMTYHKTDVDTLDNLRLTNKGTSFSMVISMYMILTDHCGLSSGAKYSDIPCSHRDEGFLAKSLKSDDCQVTRICQNPVLTPHSSIRDYLTTVGQEG